MMKVIKSNFFSDGIRCDGDLYLPEGVDNPPVVVMGLGMAALKSFRMPSFAERFVERGMAAFLFDYRTFGKSEGEPRHIVNPFHHIADWQAAIAHVRTLKEVDGTRIALWGSSFSGAHVISCAAADKGISAVVCQVPFVSGFSSMQLKSLSDMFLSTLFASFDMVRSMLSLSPHYSPAIAPSGYFAAMNSEECYEGYRSIIPEGSDWENKIASRMFFYLPLYSVMNRARKVEAPTLVMAGKHDSLIPIDAVKKMAGRLPNGELVVEDCNHFEPYTGSHFERFVQKQGDFLERHLKKETGINPITITTPQHTNVSMGAVKKILKDVLFMRLPDDPDRQMPVESKNTTLFIMLKRKRGLSKESFFNTLMTSVAAKVTGLHEELKYASFKQYHEMSLNGVLSAGFIMCRSYPISRMMCNISGADFPAPIYSTGYTPYFDCLIEFQFPSKLTSKQVKAIKKLSDDLFVISERISYCESDRRFVVYEDKSMKASNPFFLTVVTKRPHTKTRREAQDYWINEHARLVVSNVKYTRMQNYYQIHTVDSADAHFEDPFDGVAHIGFPNVLHFLLTNVIPNSLRFNNTLVVDELQLTVNSHILLLKEYDFTDFLPM